jgi:general secretion pathway protein D
MRIRAYIVVAMLGAAVAASPAQGASGSVLPPAGDPVPGLLDSVPPGPVTETTILAPPAPAQPPPVAAPARPAPAGGAFLVKFNNADVYEVIHTLGRIAGISYLIDPRVKGVVNVHTQGTMGKDDALELLFSVLKINGATAVQEGGVYHIVPMAEAKMEPMPVQPANAKFEPGLPNRPVMRAFPLQYIGAAEMAKVVKPFLSAGGEAVEVGRANMLLVIDTSGNMEKHARLVELFDADAFRSAGVKLFPLKFIDPDEMAKNLDAVFGALDFTSRAARPAGLNFVPLPRMGALLVVSASPKTLDDVARWVGELDRETTGTSRSVHLYRVRNGKVADVMAVLEKLYPGRTSPLPAKPTEFKPSVGDPSGRQTIAPGVQVLNPPVVQAAPAAQPAAAARTGVREGEGDRFDIIPDEPANALIIRGSASEYAQLLEVLKTVDVYPRQLLLEVMIGEVQLSDTLRLGVDWKYIWNGSNGAQSLSNVSSAADPTGGILSGLKYTLDKTDRLTGAFRALASDGKVSILSSPSILTANGKKGKIMVADQVPIVSASIVANSNPPVTTTTVEYKDVGVILTFTPYINDLGTVTLEIEQEVSDISSTNPTTSTNPAFFKRNVQTTLIATEDRSIVLGGMVKEKKSRNRDGIPWFYKIPGLGWLFGARADTTDRTELMIFITPRVVASSEDGTRLSSEFEERVQELKERIGEAKGIKRSQPAPASAPAAR